MKKILFILTLSVILTACGTTSQYYDRMNDLTVGMTKEEAAYLVRIP